jgi:dihydrofolate synthase/folylpolyglutamate synthase
MLEALEADRFDEIITCTPPTARAQPAGELAEAAVALGCPVRAIDDVGDALRTALVDCSNDDQIVVTGSIYLVADARDWLSQNL